LHEARVVRRTYEIHMPMTRGASVHAPMTSPFSNHFEVFGLPPAFAVDPAVLERAYRALQAEVHPDRHAQGGDAARRASMQWATRLNEAYVTLRDPLKRARYLLELEGVAVNAEGTAVMPADFLMQQMELREALEEAVAARDAGTLERLEKDVTDKRRAMQDDLAAALVPGGDRERAAELVKKLMFLDKLRTEMGDALEALA